MSEKPVTVITPSLRRWMRNRPEWSQPLCSAWTDALMQLADARRLGDKSLARLRRECVEDVTEQCEILALGDLHVQRRLECQAAWAAWYPKWVAAKLKELETNEPEIFLSDEELRLAQSQRDREADARGKAMRRALHLGRGLLAMINDAPGGVLRWEPERLARGFSSRGPSPGIRGMADALVRGGVAAWEVTPSGKKWALAITSLGAKALEYGAFDPLEGDPNC